MKRPNGFTIVELLVVVVVVGILATISLVTYSGIQQSAGAVVLQSDLKQASTQLELDRMQEGSYPSYDSEGTGIPKSDKTTYQYTTDGNSYCLSATSVQAGTNAFHISSTSGTVEEGVCDGHTEPSGGDAITNGDFIQTVTSDNCPTNRTMVVDARDNHTYWIQELADGKCWMLTNLAYAGGTANGGTDSYGDVIPPGTMQNGTEDAVNTFTEPKYYVHADSNPSIYPAEPSSNAAGGGSSDERQYGYHYNWCAAVGAQTATSACAETSALPLPDANISICPANWRLPTTGEFTALTTAIEADSSSQGSATLRSVLLAQYGSYWSDGTFWYSGSMGRYWSATQSAIYASAHNLSFTSATVNPLSSVQKRSSINIRCVVS